MDKPNSFPTCTHAEQRSKDTNTCKSTLEEGGLQSMCNGKKMSCVPNMLRNKAPKYKMMWYAALQVDFMDH